MRILIIGPPGVGTWQQATMLAAHYKIAPIMLGEVLRAAANEKKLRRAASRALSGGRPVAEQVILPLIDERLRTRVAKRGFVLQGFPRDIPSAQAIDNLLGTLEAALQVVIFMQCDAADDMADIGRRLSGRMHCRCGAVFNLQLRPPQVKNRCDLCNKKLNSPPDKEKTQAMIEEYQTGAANLIPYYKAQHKLRSVQIEEDYNLVNEKIRRIIDLEIRPLEI